MFGYSVLFGYRPCSSFIGRHVTWSSWRVTDIDWYSVGLLCTRNVSPLIRQPGNSCRSPQGKYKDVCCLLFVVASVGSRLDFYCSRKGFVKYVLCQCWNITVRSTVLAMFPYSIMEASKIILGGKKTTNWEVHGLKESTLNTKEKISLFTHSSKRSSCRSQLAWRGIAALLALCFPFSLVTDQIIQPFSALCPEL